MEAMLRKAIPAMPSLEYIAFSGNPMTAAEAERIFSLLNARNTLQRLYIPLKDSFVDAFAIYLREASSFTVLHFMWRWDGTLSLSEAAFI